MNGDITLETSRNSRPTYSPTNRRSWWDTV